MLEAILSWLGWSLGALVALAALVAGWEHMAREVGRERQPDGSRASPRGVRVDVPLDTQGAASLFGTAGPGLDLPTQPGPSEQAQRMATMERVLSRAAVPGKARRDSSVWMDTTPRVGDLNEPALPQDQAQGRRRGQQTDSSA